MNPGIFGPIPLTVGALITMVGAIIGVIKGYRWFLDSIEAVVAKALKSHEDKETVWQTEVTRRLDAIEGKVDRITEGKQ